MINQIVGGLKDSPGHPLARTTKSMSKEQKVLLSAFEAVGYRHLQLTINQVKAIDSLPPPQPLDRSYCKSLSQNHGLIFDGIPVRESPVAGLCLGAASYVAKALLEGKSFEEMFASFAEDLPLEIIEWQGDFHAVLDAQQDLPYTSLVEKMTETLTYLEGNNRRLYIQSLAKMIKEFPDVGVQELFSTLDSEETPSDSVAYKAYLKAKKRIESQQCYKLSQAEKEIQQALDKQAVQSTDPNVQRLIDLILQCPSDQNLHDYVKEQFFKKNDRNARLYFNLFNQLLSKKENFYYPVTDVMKAINEERGLKMGANQAKTYEAFRKIKWEEKTYLVAYSVGKDELHSGHICTLKIGQKRALFFDLNIGFGVLPRSKVNHLIETILTTYDVNPTGDLFGIYECSLR